MPSPDLLKAISRLDQAVSRAESSLDAAQATLGENKQRDKTVKQTIAELDDIIASLKGGTHG